MPIILIAEVRFNPYWQLSGTSLKQIYGKLVQPILQVWKTHPKRWLSFLGFANKA